jgi:hypothetical protein
MTESISDNTSSTAQPLLPDIDELFRAVEQEIDQEKPPAYVASSAALGTPDSDPSAFHSGAAAVLSTFDPRRSSPSRIRKHRRWWPTIHIRPSGAPSPGPQHDGG